MPYSEYVMCTFQMAIVVVVVDDVCVHVHMCGCVCAHVYACVHECMCCVYMWV